MTIITHPSETTLNHDITSHPRRKGQRRSRVRPLFSFYSLLSSLLWRKRHRHTSHPEYAPLNDARSITKGRIALQETPYNDEVNRDKAKLFRPGEVNKALSTCPKPGPHKRQYSSDEYTARLHVKKSFFSLIYRVHRWAIRSAICRLEESTLPPPQTVSSIIIHVGAALSSPGSRPTSARRLVSSCLARRASCTAARRRRSTLLGRSRMTLRYHW